MFLVAKFGKINSWTGDCFHLLHKCMQNDTVDSTVCAKMEIGMDTDHSCIIHWSYIGGK